MLGKTAYHSVTVQISSSSKAPVGLYNLQLNIQSQFEFQSCILGGFILLFNPWCTGGVIYMYIYTYCIIFSYYLSHDYSTRMAKLVGFS